MINLTEVGAFASDPTPAGVPVRAGKERVTGVM